IHELLFVPKKTPFQQTMKEKNIKLFVPRVFIVNDCKDLSTGYLSFIRCLEDIECLPLNLSRESLQQNNVLNIIQKNVVNKCLELFGEIAENKADFINSQFDNLVELLVEYFEDSKNRNKLADLLKYRSIKFSEELKSLKECVSGENQKNLCCITGESRFLESMIDFNVLFLVDYIDGSAIQQLLEYDGKKFVCTKVGFDLPLTEGEKKVSFFLKVYLFKKKN
ncbi:heat shock protein 90A, partial [Reticulomyxa filosa]